MSDTARHLITFRDDYHGAPSVTLRVADAAMQFNVHQQDREAADFPEHVASLSPDILAGLGQTGFQAVPITPKQELQRMPDSALKRTAFGLGIDPDQSRTKLMNAITKAGATDTPTATDEEE